MTLAKTFINHETVVASGSAVFRASPGHEIIAFWNIVGPVTGGGATIVFTLAEVDPTDETTVSGHMIVSGPVTASGVGRIILPFAVSPTLKVSWTVTGSSPSFGDTSLVVSSKVSSPVQTGSLGITGPVRVDQVGVTGPVRVDRVGITGFVQVTGPMGVTGQVAVVGAVGITGPVRVDSVGGTGPFRVDAVGVTGPVRVDSVGITGYVQATGPMGVTGLVSVVGPVGVTGPVSVNNHPTGIGVSGTVGVTGTVRAIVVGPSFNDPSQFLDQHLGEHALDPANKPGGLLMNGAATPFTADPGTDVFTSVGHGLVAGDAVNLTTTGTLPAPLTTSTTSTTGVVTETIYWVINVATDTFQLSASPGGSAVNVTSAGTGTHSFQKRGQFVGTFKDVSQVGYLTAAFVSNVKPAVLRYEWSADGSTRDVSLVGAGTNNNFIVESSTAGVYVGTIVTNNILNKYYRVRIVNGPSNQSVGFTDFSAFIGKEPYQGSYSVLNSQLTNFTTALLTRSVQAGVTANDVFKNVRTQGKHDANSSTTPLAGNGVFRGTWLNWQEDFVGLVLSMSTDVPGSIFIDFSESASPVNGSEASVTDSLGPFAYDPAQTPLFRRHVTVTSKWVRIRYMNGAAAQTRFTVDCVLLAGAATAPLQDVSILPALHSIGGIGQAIITAERQESTEFVHVKTTRNDSNKDGLHAHITGIEDHVALKPLEAAQARQFTVGASPVQVDTPVLSTPGKRRVLGVQTRGFSWTAYGFSSAITFTGNAMLLPPNSFKTIALDEGVNVWFVTEQTGGTQTTQNLNGSSASGTAASPSNALTSDDTRASISANGQTVRVTGFAYTPTASSTIQSVRVGCEARKQSGQESTVSHVATVTQASPDGPGNVGSITSSAVTGGSSRLILVAVSRENENAAVNSVTNTGTALTWTKLQDVTAGSTRRLDVWWAYGNPGATFTVTANFSQTATNCHIAVSTYDGVDPSTPISSSGTNTGTGTSVTGPSLTGANKQLSYLAVVQDSATATAGTGYTERSDESTATGANADRDGLSTHTKALTVGGSEQGSATLSTSVTWGSVGIIIDSAPATDPVITLSYETPNGTAGPTTGLRTYSSETDASQFLDITGDRSWTESNVDNIVLVATGQSIGAASCEVDRLWIEIVDTTGNTTRISVEQYAGAP